MNLRGVFVRKLLKKWGLKKAEKRNDKEAKEGRVYAYLHATGKVGAMIKLGCETDFVSRSSEFEDLCKELAMQVCSMNPKNIKELLGQDYIRDSKIKVEDLIKQASGKLKEKIEVKEIARAEV